jgi:hypothetical protein
MLPLSLDALIRKEVVVEAEVEVVVGVREERGIKDMWSEEEVWGEMGKKRQQEKEIDRVERQCKTVLIGGLVHIQQKTIEVTY